MAKKRSHSSDDASLDASQKKQKHLASPSSNSHVSKTAYSRLGQIPSQTGERYERPEDTRNATPKSIPGTDREAHNIPQQVSKFTQAQVQNPHSAENATQFKYLNANGSNEASGNALNFPVLLRSSSGTSTDHSAFPKSANATIKSPPYSDRSSTLPPLPNILDKALESVVFTHPGILSCDIASKVNISYDRLEFLGDAYIELMATRLLFSRFPSLPAGRLSQRREMLVKNETLAEYALAYGFDKKAKLPRGYNTPGKDQRKLWLKALGDIFEAFVAAVIISDPEQGFQVAEAWLTVLWEPKLGSPKREDAEIADPKAKLYLATKIMSKGIKIDYRDEAPPVEIRREGKLVFQIGVYLTGWGWEDQRLGTGKGLNKQEAGQRAAADALVNPLTAQVASIKRHSDAQLALERGTEDDISKLKDSAVRKDD